MTLQDLREELRRMLVEYDTVVLPDSVLNIYLNEGYRDFCWRTVQPRADYTMTLTPNQSIVTLPQWTGHVIRMVTVTGNQVLKSATVRDLESLYGIGWRNLNGNPAYFLRLSNTQFRLVPATPTTTGWSDTLIVHLSWIPSPDPSAPVRTLQADTDVPQIPEVFHRALIYYALRQLAARDISSPLLAQRAQIFWAHYAEFVANAIRTEDEMYRSVAVPLQVPTAAGSERRE